MESFVYVAEVVVVLVVGIALSRRWGQTASTRAILVSGTFVLLALVVVAALIALARQR